MDYRGCMVLALWLGCGGLAASGATVLLKNEPTPVRGYFVSENERGVTLRVAGPDGEFHERLIPHAAIDILLRPVDETRLAELSPDTPRAYRDYAEELAEKRVDPEARQASLRLYLIAAHLAPDELGRSALLGMIPLARNESERRRFRAMAYLLDPDQNRQLLKPSADSGGETSGGDESADSPQVKLLVRALEMLRRGRHLEANRLIRRPGMGEILDTHRDLMSFDEFTELCADRLPRGPEPPADAVARILQLELRLLEKGTAASDVPASSSARFRHVDGPWETLDAEQLSEVISELSLESLTELDPRECLYRDGRWVVPDSP
jgi:hypothetical protein